MEHSFNSRGVNHTYRLLKWEQPKGSQEFLLYFEVKDTWYRFLFGERSVSKKLTVRGSGTVWHTYPDGIRLSSEDERFVSRHFQQRVQWDLEEMVAKEFSGIPGVSPSAGRVKIYDPELLMIEKLKDDSKLTSK